MKKLKLFDWEEDNFTPEVRRLEEKYSVRMRRDLQMSKLVSYVGNKDLPVLRLYRYKEAFAFYFVDKWLTRLGVTKEDLVFDPFCGMGTTLFTASCRGIPAFGIDRLPLAVFITKTLPLFLQIHPGKLSAIFEHLRALLSKVEPAPIAMDVAIMRVAFSADTLMELRRWKTAIESLHSPFRDIFLFLFFSVLDACSYTSKDGQFLRLHRGKRVCKPEDALARKVRNAEEDIRRIRDWGWDKTYLPFRVTVGDTRRLGDIALGRSPTVIITSPPYANRYDYTRTYSLELCFHFVRNFPELRALRHSMLRSHIEAKVSDCEQPSHPAVKELVESLRIRSKQLNNPKIPDMLTAYFVDMQKAIEEWKQVLTPSAHVIMVVDNVRFEGQMLPVDLILSEMAEQQGFTVEEIIIARYKGNSSQQMGRYGRLPVRESVVVWRREG